MACLMAAQFVSVLNILFRVAAPAPHELIDTDHIKKVVIGRGAHMKNPALSMDAVGYAICACQPFVHENCHSRAGVTFLRASGHNMPGA